MERLTYRGKNGKFYVRADGYYQHCRMNLDSVAERLAAYEDAEEQGLLVRLPCKVGDTFWWIEKLVGDNKPFIRSGQVSEIGISDAITIYEYDGRDFSLEDVYFTLKEAESALAKDINVTSKGENNG